MNGSLPISLEIIGLNAISLNPRSDLLDRLPREVRCSDFQKAFSYLRDLEMASIETYRNKVVFVGFQAVGKTSLFHSLFPIRAKLQQGDLFLAGRVLIVSSLTNHRYFVLDASWDCTMEERLSLKITPRRDTDVRSILHHAGDDDERVAWKTAEELFQISRPVNQLTSIVIYFLNEASRAYWHSNIKHWTNNVATEGITTSIIDYPRQYVHRFLGSVKMQLCFMDFGGQPELEHDDHFAKSYN